MKRTSAAIMQSVLTLLVVTIAHVSVAILEMALTVKVKHTFMHQCLVTLPFPTTKILTSVKTAMVAVNTSVTMALVTFHVNVNKDIP